MKEKPARKNIQFRSCIVCGHRIENGSLCRSGCPEDDIDITEREKYYLDTYEFFSRTIKENKNG